MNEFASTSAGVVTRLPRIGFLGIGWIGRNRMKAMVDTGIIDAVAVADPSDEMIEAAFEIAPCAHAEHSFEALLKHGLDGVVIATPSAAHAEQSIIALDRGLAVFCQKPVGRTGAEVERVVDAARRAGRLLGADMSYRHIHGMRRIRELIRAGQLGRVFAADLVFHNAYGPDKPWFYDRALSGGGCVIDLGVHLVDLALWALDFPSVRKVDSTVFGEGRPLPDDGRQVEDFAVATLELESGATVRIACSWRLNAGCDAVIRATFMGTQASVEMRNVEGSFYDFVTEQFTGTQRHILAAPADDWGGRAAGAWARKLAGGAGFDPACERLTDVARVLDRIYRRPAR